LPENLLNQAEKIIREGWATDLNALLAEALRRYLESHSMTLSEQFVREDIQWGLYGK
jgi:metal-responsive CopG/Arc/MetJ family transcriptional regulator